MKKHACAAALLLCICLVLPLLGACGQQVSPAEILSRFASLCPLPAGRFYDSEAAEYEEGYLPPDMFALLYARPDGGDDREDVRRFALFLGTSPEYVAEAGVFECPDRDAAYEVVGMLRGRLATLMAMKEADISFVSDAVISLYGSTVVYFVLPDNAKAERTMDRLLS